MPSLAQPSGSDNRSSPGKRSHRSMSDVLPMIKERRKWSLATAFTNSRKPSSSNTNVSSGSSPSFVNPDVANDLYQLQKYTNKIRSVAKNINHIDSAWDEYMKCKERCFECCKALSIPPSHGRESFAASPTAHVSPKFEHLRNLSSETLDLVAIDTAPSTPDSGGRIEFASQLGSHDETCREAVREWEGAVELLANTLRTSLYETYNEYDKDPTPLGFEKICMDKAARQTTIYNMRIASISKMMSADLNFFPLYDIRFRNYDEVKKDLAKLRSLLGTSGIAQNRTIIERRIAPTGDVMLEFPNLESDEHPVFRFRVASDCLRELSSSVFGHMFNTHPRAELDDDIRRSLPCSPTRHVCSDGNEVKLYRMPQTELNTHRSLEILLHAAHNHHDRVPRAVPFSQFVSIAEACLRYQCTSPLELAVEHLWLPFWREHATDAMLEEVLLISYVFGLPENFVRLSRMAILSMTDSDCLRYKSWPRKVGERIAAARRAKQVYEQCRTTLNEYLCVIPGADPPASIADDQSHGEPSSSSSSSELLRLRCPRGDHICDAQNLGWLMKRLGELGMLPAILQSSAFPSSSSSCLPSPKTQRSLLEMINALRLIASPPQRHGGGGGICDFAPAFRAAVRDIYESVPGLTLFDVSGKRGWALSKDRSPRHSAQSQNQSQSQSNGATGTRTGTNEQLFRIAQQRYAPDDHHQHQHQHHNHRHHDHRRSPISLLEASGGNDGRDHDRDDDDTCLFKILSLLDDPRDLRAAAMINRRFYRSYLRNETRLWEGIPGGAAGTATVPPPHCPAPTHIAEADGTACFASSSSSSSSSGTGMIVIGTGDDHEYPVVPPREKFRFGQVLLVEDKRLVEENGEKYAACIREPLLLGLRSKGAAGLGWAGPGRGGPDDARGPCGMNEKKNYL
ncbi:hypothetical protein F5Y14DRAFT_160726 [Nemania sp. NC0429]|nr:hypothetical protein F5Y14DRAFT_160726 [Nemania sp. NC0429]